MIYYKRSFRGDFGPAKSPSLGGRSNSPAITAPAFQAVFVPEPITSLEEEPIGDLLAATGAGAFRRAGRVVVIVVVVLLAFRLYVESHGRPPEEPAETKWSVRRFGGSETDVIKQTEPHIHYVNRGRPSRTPLYLTGRGISDLGPARTANEDPGISSVTDDAAPRRGTPLKTW